MLRIIFLPILIIGESLKPLAEMIPIEFWRYFGDENRWPCCLAAIATLVTVIALIILTIILGACCIDTTALNGEGRTWLAVVLWSIVLSGAYVGFYLLAQAIKYNHRVYNRYFEGSLI